jgi:RNA binding exosome subunit
MCGVPTLPLSSSKYPIAYMEIRVFSHATEDLEKVESAVRNMLPKALGETLNFSKLSLTGHHGNPIVLLEANFKDKTQLPLALEKIVAALSSLDKEQLCLDMKQHIEKHNLYLRFDKQSAFLGAIMLVKDDPIHFKIHFKNKTPEQIMELCKQAGLG